MKIALVSFYKTTEYNPNYYYPLALYYLKAFAEKELGDEVAFGIRDYCVDDDPNWVVCDLLKDDPDLIGFSCYVWNTKEILELTHVIKTLQPQVQIVLGGPQVSHTADAVLAENRWVDVVVRGEGEQPFAEVLKHYRGQGPTLSDIKGITYRSGADVRSNPSRPLIEDLDDIPSPFTGGLQDKPYSILIETQRGCPFECAFCDSHKNFKSVRYFSLERVKKDLTFLLSSGIKRLFLADSTFNLDRTRAKEILRHIASENKGTLVNTELRAELLDREMVELLEKAGVEFVEFGLQSTNPETAKNIGRQTNFPKFEEGIQLLKNSKIAFVIQLIIGLPGDDLAAFKKSMDYVLALAPNAFQAFDLQLLPGTPLYVNADQYGLLFHLEPPHVVIQNATFSYRELMLAKQLSREAHLVDPRNYGGLAQLTKLRNSELLEKCIAWRDARVDLPYDGYERLKGMKRLRLFSRFVQELLVEEDPSLLRKLSVKLKCNLQVVLIVLKYLNKVALRLLEGR